MDFAADFTAIDFETASRRPDSACQLAAVKVRGGRIVNEAMWMIRPEPFFFSRMNIGIHGITPQQVQAEPEFGELWDDIARQLGDDCLVAHNASFDMGVLLACLHKHNKQIPEMQFTCTRAIARRTWPKRRRYGLKPLSDWLGVRFQHHDALEDSIACAKVLLAAGIDRRAGSLPDLEKKLRLTRGAAGAWGKKGPARKLSQRSRGSRSGKPASQLVHEQRAPLSTEPAVDLQRLLIRADFIRPLAGERVVFTGRMQSISREEAELLASRGGGECQRDVNGKTSFLVVGTPDKDLAGHHMSAKHVTAEKLRRQGHAIRIVNETEFLRMVVRAAENETTSRH